MITKFVFFIFSLIAIFTDLPIIALPIPSFYQGMPYSEARAKMIGLGWQVPVVNYSETCKWMKEICNEYPEVDDCSGTGMGFCSSYIVSLSLIFLENFGEF